MQNIPINLSSQEILQQYNQEASIDNMREEQTMPMLLEKNKFHENQYIS